MSDLNNSLNVGKLYSESPIRSRSPAKLEHRCLKQEAADQAVLY